MQIKSVRKCSDRYIETKIDGDVILMDIDAGSFHALKKSSVAIWQMLDETDRTDVLSDTVCARFEVEPDIARAQLETLFLQLEGAGFVTLVR